MINVSIKKIDRSITKWLTKKGIEVPEEARTVEHIYVPKFTEYTEMFTFKDRNKLRLTQHKDYVNKKTNEKTTQIREYDYIKRMEGTEKISEIKQKTILPDGKETKELWRFYHAKDYSPVRFSRKGTKAGVNTGVNEIKEINKDNYLRANGVYTDRNGLKIRPISTAEYYDKKRDLDENHFVDAPWTLGQSITTKDRCGTDSIQECTVVGIYGDKGLSLNHLNPNNKINSEFQYIDFALMEQLEQQGKNAKAFVIGSCESDWRSDDQFKNIIDLFATEQVPFSKYKTGDKVLYGPFYDNSLIRGDGLKKHRNGTATRFEWKSGQHIIYENGEIQLANPVIDAELKKGNTSPKKLIKKSFTQFEK